MTGVSKIVRLVSHVYHEHTCTLAEVYVQRHKGYSHCDFHGYLVCAQWIVLGIQKVINNYTIDSIILDITQICTSM
jgi:hypothetical protein